MISVIAKSASYCFTLYDNRSDIPKGIPTRFLKETINVIVISDKDAEELDDEVLICSVHEKNIYNDNFYVWTGPQSDSIRNFIIEKWMALELVNNNYHIVKNKETTYISVAVRTDKNNETTLSIVPFTATSDTEAVFLAAKEENNCSLSVYKLKGVAYLELECIFKEC